MDSLKNFKASLASMTSRELKEAESLGYLNLPSLTEAGKAELFQRLQAITQEITERQRGSR